MFFFLHNLRSLSQYAIMVMVFLVLFSGCVSTAFLEKDKYLLTKQVIKGNKNNSTEDLELQFQQKGNRKILGSMPYLYAYFLGKKFHNPAKIEKNILQMNIRYAGKIEKNSAHRKRVARLEARRDRKLTKLQTKLTEGNFMMRVIGEPPVILDSAQTQKTADEMGKLLFNNGYFEATVRYEVTERFGKARIKYYITENEPHKVKYVRYVTDDSRIKHLLDSTKKRGEIKVDTLKPYKQSKIVAERERIDQLMRSSGYFGFSRKYVSLKVDTLVIDSTTGNHRLVGLTYMVQNPPKGHHKPYRLNDIKVFIDSDKDFTPDTIWRYNGIQYRTNKRNFSDKVLDTKILQHPKEWYNYEKLQNSQAQMASMDIFKFVNFNFDSTAGNLNLNVFTSRLPRYQISDELGLVVSAGAPGPFANVGFKVRNVFRNFGIFEINGRYSQEGQLSAFSSDKNTIYRATEWSVNTSLLFPNIILPGHLSKYLRAYSPRTRLTLGYTSTVRPEYNRDIIKSTLTYTLQTAQHTQIGFSPINVSINRTLNISDAFKTYLEEQASKGVSLIQSFNNSIVTNMSAYYMYNTNETGVNKRSKYFRVSAEWGGELADALNKLFVKNHTDTILGLKYFKFAKINADFRFYQPITVRTMFASRINAGIAIPRGRTRNGKATILPLEKYFFSGGSNSIRAWAPRRLGLGSYTYRDSNGVPTYQFEQPGNIILEASVEIRQKLFSFVEMAIFADAGNVWALEENAGNRGAQFRVTRFWEQIALGTGLGLRMNFSFLIVRFDAGIKTYDPARPLNERWVLHKWHDENQILLNVGIGYPF